MNKPVSGHVPQGKEDVVLIDVPDEAWLADFGAKLTFFFTVDLSHTSLCAGCRLSTWMSWMSPRSKHADAGRWL